MDKGFFIILDRLQETLDVQINKWHKDHKKFKGSFMGIGRNKRALQELMVQRMTVAYDLAAAFMYLHENRSVVRVSWKVYVAPCPHRLFVALSQNNTVSCIVISSQKI